MEEIMRFFPVGDQAVLVQMGSHIDEDINRKVMHLAKQVEDNRLPGVLETVPAFTSLLVYYNLLETNYKKITQELKRLADCINETELTLGRVVKIPVCYGGEYGEDLPFVAAHAGLSQGEVIRIHSERNYRIHMLGFLPGFPYLGGMDERIFTPRLSSPRTRIPAGSVGIGGEQTGIYPMDSPGGWQLIGRTPLRLYDPEHENTVLYQPGDEIRFVPISAAEYKKLNGGV